MMRYEYEHDGERVTIDLPMAEATPLGESREINGRMWKRVPSSPEICGGGRRGSSRFPRFESHQLPRWWKHHKGAFSEHGKPRFTSREQVEDGVARARHEGTDISYGEL